MVCGRSVLRQGLDSQPTGQRERRVQGGPAASKPRPIPNAYIHTRDELVHIHTHTHTYINIQRKRKAVGPSIMLLSSCVIWIRHLGGRFMNRPSAVPRVRCLAHRPPCVTVIETTVLKKPIAAPTDPHTSSTSASAQSADHGGQKRAPRHPARVRNAETNRWVAFRPRGDMYSIKSQEPLRYKQTSPTSSSIIQVLHQLVIRAPWCILSQESIYSTSRFYPAPHMFSHRAQL